MFGITVFVLGFIFGVTTQLVPDLIEFVRSKVDK